MTYAQHPYYDDFWRERTVKARWRDLDVPTLEIAGWYDRYRDGMVANFQARKENVWLVAGPWQHGMPAGQYADIGAAGNAYTLPCNGSDNQNWLVIQRAARRSCDGPSADGSAVAPRDVRQPRPVDIVLSSTEDDRPARGCSPPGPPLARGYRQDANSPQTPRR